MRINALLTLSILIVFGAACKADVIYDVSLGDTTSLIGNSNAPFALDFQFTDGSGTGDANNTVTLSQFNFGIGGSAGSASTIQTSGSPSGNLSSQVVLTDNTFFTEFSQQFNPGNTLSFQLDLTNNADAGGTPDEFTFQLLDNTGNEVSTTDPSGSNSLLIIDLTGATLQPNAYSTNGDNVTITATYATPMTGTPEPATGWLIVAAVLCFAGLLRAHTVSLDATK